MCISLSLYIYIYTHTHAYIPFARPLRTRPSACRRPGARRRSPGGARDYNIHNMYITIT